MHPRSEERSRSTPLDATSNGESRFPPSLAFAGNRPSPRRASLSARTPPRVSSASGPDAPATENAPYILYGYRFAGEEYRSLRYDFPGAKSSDLSFIMGILARYPEGATVTCYVHPEHPEQVVLEPGMNGWLPVPSLVFSLPFMAVGLWLLLAALAGWRPAGPLVPPWVREAPGIVTGAVEGVLRSCVTAVNKMRDR